MARQKKNIKRIIGVNALVILFALAGAFALGLGLLGILYGFETFSYSVQCLIIGTLMGVAAYGLHRGAMRSLWICVVAYIILAIALNAYLVLEQHQTELVVKIIVYLVILIGMATPKVRRWFQV